MLDRSLAHGVAWMGTVKWLTQLLSWASTLVVARLLTPADYGLMGLAVIYHGIVTMLSEFGIGTTIVAMRGLSDDQHAQINSLSVMFGAASFVVSCVAAPLLARFFAAPELTWVVITMSTIFLITGVRVVPQALLQRDMRFRDLALNDGLQALVLAAGSVLFALLGFRYWTLVLSAVLGALLSTIGVLWLVRVPFRWPHWATLAPAVNFSRQTIVGRLAWYVYDNADFFVAGKVLGKDPLGAYRFGWDLASTPPEKITTLVARVTPSILSAAQGDKAALRRYLLRITEALALATFPATIGLGVVAPILVPLVLGAKWSAMIVPLQLLSISAAIRSVSPMPLQVMTVIGQNHYAMRVNVVGAIIMPLAFWFGSRWGTTGLAAAWLAVYPFVVVLPTVLLTSRALEFRLSDYLRALAAPTTGVVAMVLAVWGLREWMEPALRPAMQLAVDVIVGAVVYTLTILTVHRQRVQGLITAFRSARAPATPESAPSPSLPVRASPALASPSPTPFHVAPGTPGPRRMLLVSVAYPPSAEVGALRWQKIAQTARNRGWTIDVILVDPTDAALREVERLREVPPGARLFDVPLREVAAQRAERRFRQLLRLGRRRSGNEPAGAAMPPAGEGQGRAASSERIGRVLRAYRARVQFAQWNDWAARAAATGIAIARTTRYDVIASSGPPHAAHEAARRVAASTGRPLVIDLRDPWLSDDVEPPELRGPHWRAVTASDEARAVRQAALVVVNTDSCRQLMVDRYPALRDRFLTVMNGADPDVGAPATPGTEFIISHTGSLYSGRDPRILFRAVAAVVQRLRLQPGDLRIHFMGDEVYEGRSLEALAAECGVEPFTVCEGRRPRAAALELIRASAMVVLLPQQHVHSIPGKVFEYVQLPAWPLVLADPGSATELLLRDTGADVLSPTDLEGVADAIARRYCAFRRGERPAPLNADGRFDRDRQTARLLDALDALT